jgi:nucleotide-binding universal stress UspA family protein
LDSRNREHYGQIAARKAQMNAGSAPIIHPTDFSAESMNAFAHALKISLTAKCKLYIVHVADRENADDWHAFPQVRQILARWRLLDAKAPTSAIFERLGVEVVKVEIEPQDPVHGLARFLEGHPGELMVLATHGREGLPRWVRPSIAEAMSRRTHMQTLFIPAGSSILVDAATGDLDLNRILIPVDHHPAPAAAIWAIQQFYRALGAEPEIRVLHVGKNAPVTATISTPSHRAPLQGPVEVRDGDVVDGILAVAAEMKANLIGMATAGHHGLLDALRGSTTERVLRQSPCPVLAIPVGGH